MRGNIYPVKYGYKVRYGRKITKHFKSFKDAEDFLIGLRFKDREGSFDIRDYKKGNPLGFENLANEYLKKKGPRHKQWFAHAIKAWGNRNIKTIKTRDVEELKDHLLEIHAPKTVKDEMAAYSAFWNRLVYLDDLRADSVPKFPKIDAKSKFRKLVSVEDQERVLEQIREDTWHFNPRVYIAVHFLRTYISTRPKELISIKEKDILLDIGMIYVGETKTGEDRFIPLIDEDIELIRSVKRGFPYVYFFRHEKGNGGAKPGQQFGKDYLYNVWKRACAKLNIENVDLYGGTRHSTAVALRDRFTPEEIKRGMGTKSNKAFERYLQITPKEKRRLYQGARDNVVKLHEVKKRRGSGS